MMKKVVALVALCVIGAVAQQTLIATVRDFNPGFPDFEHYSAEEIGAVQSLLDQDGKPVLNTGSHVSFSAPNWFGYWYRDVTNINIPFTFNIPMTESAGTYTYSNNAFFPIDNMGWGNGGNTHNYDFTTEFNLFFTYTGGETFTFSSANDMWVFVNNQLAVDMGGAHLNTLSASLSIDEIAVAFGLTIGQNYEIDIFAANRHVPNSVLSIATTAVLSSFPSNEPVAVPGVDIWMCEVLLTNFCPGAPVNPNNTFGNPGYGSSGDSSSGVFTGSNSGAADGNNDEGVPSKRDSQPCTADYPTLTFSSGGGAYGLDNFNVISFDSFNAASGDIEGRLAVRNTLNLPSGQFSVGYQLRTGGVTAWDNSLPYAVVVGGDATWNSGDVYPDGSNSPYNGEEEGIFIGGTFTGSSDLRARITGSCPQAGCLDDQFDSAQSFFANVQNSFAALVDTATSSNIQYGSLVITCSDLNADSYSITVDAASFSTITSYTLNGCNRNSQIVINIVGSGDVNFQGAQIDHQQEKVLYNILATGTVFVQTGVAGSILAPNNQYNQPSSGVVMGNLIVANVIQALQINRLHCVVPTSGPHPPAYTNICPAWETDCAGLAFPLGNEVYSFRDFNVISFDSYYASTADVEGRLAAKNDVSVGAGYSFGQQLQTSDNTLPYTLVVGRDLTFLSGAVYPDGSGLPYPGEMAGIFVGGTVQAASNDLKERVTGHCSTPGCLDTYFNAAEQCYTGYQNALAAQPDNVVKSIYWDGLFLTCNDVTADVYFITLTPSDISSFTYTSVDNCNFQAFWVINIAGSGDVTLSGASFPAVCGGVVYNFQGSGRTMTVTDTSVCGHILAPSNILNQPGGVIEGKVVFGNVAKAWQINKQNSCPNPGNVTLYTATSSNANQGETYLHVQTNGNLRDGDSVYFSGLGISNTISSIVGNTIYLANPLAGNVPAGSIITTTVPNSGGRPPKIDQAPSSSQNSSSALSVAISLVLALLALAF